MTAADPTIAFPQSPSDALQCVLDLKAGGARLRQMAAGGVDIGSIGDAIVANETDWLDWQHFLAVSEPYWWSEATAALVTSAATSYPLDEAEEAARVVERDQQWIVPTGQPTYLPRLSSGIHLFARPCFHVTIDGVPRVLTGLGWRVGIAPRERELRLSIRGIAWAPPYAFPVWWSDGGSTSDGDDAVDATFRAERVALTKWLCTAAMFVEQEIVVATPTRGSRAVARRAARIDRDAGTCHVITLRHELHEDEPAREGSSVVEWAHRWIVRGHWRRQFFPSRGTHAPMWIHPHVKGPSDKPFAPEKPVVFAVRR